MEVQESEVSTQLTFKDIQLMKTIIEGCASRGVFRAQEFTLVGNLYDKINSTVTSIENENRTNK